MISWSHFGLIFDILMDFNGVFNSMYFCNIHNNNTLNISRNNYDSPVSGTEKRRIPSFFLFCVFC